MSKNQDLGELINGIKSLATNQLNAPAYTSALSFTGTLAGLLGFDSSGNVISLASTSLTLNSSQVTTALGFTPYNATNPSGYISGITSLMVTTALGYTPYNSSNPSGYISGINSGMVTSALGYTPVPTTRTITINGVTYDLSADRSWTVSGSGTITGSGTNNYVTKWTGTSSIGNSNIQDSGTLVSINSETYVNGLTSANKLILYGGPEMIRMYASIPFISFYNAANTTRFGYIQAYAGEMAIVAEASNPLNFNAGGSNRMSILTNGNVLIGTTTDAGYKLDVNGTGRFSGNVTISSNSSLTVTGVYNVPSTSYFKGNTTYGYRFNNAADTVNLLILADTGAATFSSSVTANSRIVSFSTGYGLFHTDSSSYNVYLDTRYISADNGYLLETGKNGANAVPYLALGTADTERMRILADGRIGINTSSPYSYVKLHVANGFRANADAATGTGVIEVYRSGSSNNVYIDGNLLTLYNQSSNDTITMNAFGINISGLPTSSAGLSSGYLWQDGSGYLRIVP